MKAHINDAYINPTGATGNGDYSGSSGQAGAINATGHSSNTAGSSGQAENKPTINPDAVGYSAEDLYRSNGDDYTIDDNAFSNAQMKTGDDKKADSVVGSGGNDSETNSNVNTGVFGGPARAAHPGYSLW